MFTCITFYVHCLYITSTLFVYSITTYPLSHSSHSKLHLLTFLFICIILCFSKVAPANRPSSMYTLCELSGPCTSMNFYYTNTHWCRPSCMLATWKFPQNCVCFSRTCMLGTCAWLHHHVSDALIHYSFCVCTFQ